ncbi:MAG: signal recognition particle protein [Deltaproteobacteria bacterium]|nr:MAG: signal recognition particle protein [Deltaproteobacteria bacterium]RLB21676.1 MAG: signal recognition particle protein [Deltaproteobacteria bacterium]
MFELLTEKLSRAFKELRGRGRLNEKNIQEALKQIRLAFLEADVNYKVVKNFLEEIRQRSLGKEVMESLTPGQQVIKIVQEELTKLMGEGKRDLNLNDKKPLSLMLVGLQGSGKTTTAGKLANYIRKNGYHPYLVPVDTQRPAAIEQLCKIGEEINIPVYPADSNDRVEDICLKAKKEAPKVGCDILVIDTAGRLHIDEQLMEELLRIKGVIHPAESLLVADAMTGQDAVNLAVKFNQVLDITGVILSKMEGDARGGAALSVMAVTNKPIKFVGIGESMDALEPFYPDRMSSRILGMGDVLSLIDKAQAEFDQKEAMKLARKIKKAEFDLEDFKQQLAYIQKMGSLEQILGMMPGIGKMMKAGRLKTDEKELVRVEAIINSMTPEERRNHRIISGSRRKRIAMGSGTKVEDVNRLLKNFVQTKNMLKKLSRGGLKGLSSMAGFN